MRRIKKTKKTKRRRMALPSPWPRPREGAQRQGPQGGFLMLSLKVEVSWSVVFIARSSCVYVPGYFSYLFRHFSLLLTSGCWIIYRLFFISCFSSCWVVVFSLRFVWWPDWYGCGIPFLSLSRHCTVHFISCASCWPNNYLLLGADSLRCVLWPGCCGLAIYFSLSCGIVFSSIFCSSWSNIHTFLVADFSFKMFGGLATVEELWSTGCHVFIHTRLCTVPSSSCFSCWPDIYSLLVADFSFKM